MSNLYFAKIEAPPLGSICLMRNSPSPLPPGREESISADIILGENMKKGNELSEISWMDKEKEEKIKEIWRLKCK
jgi:hypothetical protein